MANDKYIQVLLPVGRLVGGDLYEPQVKDFEGRPLTFKDGSPRVNYYIAVAIPKTQAHWANEVDHTNPRVGAWGAKIWEAGHKFWGDIAGKKQNFAWKIIDGDSQQYNDANPPRRPCDNIGYPGHWVISLGRTQAPTIVNSDGSQYLLEKGRVKRGYFVQVAATVTSNNSEAKMGIYINHDAVSLQYHGEEISYAPKPSEMGFGGGAAPVGAQPIPAGAIGIAPPVAPSAPAPVAPVPPVTHAPPVPQPLAPPPQIQPNHGFVNNAAGFAPATVAAPPAPPAPPAAPVVKMLNNGATLDSYLQAGWTMEQIAASGLFVVN